MKKLIFSLAVVFISTVSFAQLTEGSVSYKIDLDSDNPMVQQQLGMMSNATMTMSFSGSAFRQDMDMGVQKSSTIHNGKKGKKEQSIMLTEAMGTKMAVEMPKKDDSDKKEEDKPKVEVTDETKEIVGYTCKKVIITDGENETILYVTDQIKPASDKNQFGGGLVDGFPLLIEVEQPMVSMIMTATEVNKTAPDKSMFSTKIPKDYTIKTWDEFKSMAGGGM